MGSRQHARLIERSTPAWSAAVLGSAPWVAMSALLAVTTLVPVLDCRQDQLASRVRFPDGLDNDVRVASRDRRLSVVRQQVRRYARSLLGGITDGDSQLNLLPERAAKSAVPAWKQSRNLRSNDATAEQSNLHSDSVSRWGRSASGMGRSGPAMARFQLRAS